MTPQEQREKFVAAWLANPSNPFQAAQTVFGGNITMCLIASQQWTVDPDVLALRERIVAEKGPRAFLPTKEETARDLWEAAQDAKRLLAYKEYNLLMKLYSDIMAYIDKPGTNLNVGVTIPSVMVVRSSSSDEEWRRDLANSQQALTQNVSIN